MLVPPWAMYRLTLAPPAQQFGQDGRRLVRVADVMGLAPVIEPSVPPLHDHGGLAGTKRSQLGQAGLWAGTEVRRRRDIGQCAVAQPVRARAIGGKQPAVDAAGDQTISDVSQVGRVAAVGAVLVLDLDADDRASMARLQRRDDGGDGVQPGIRGSEKR